LEAQRGASRFDFETVLACLEELDEFKVRQTNPHCPDRIGGFLSAFADLKPDFIATAGDSLMRARWSLVNGLTQFVMRQTAHSSPSKLKDFFDVLRDNFNLTVVTLNYDDIIDKAGVWYDGFEPLNGSTKQFGRFDSAGFPHESMVQPAILLHLHGSVRFGFDPDSADRDIVRYAAATDAFKSVKRKSSVGQHAPIISGQRKDRWMTRACMPFGYYHNVLVNAVCECPRVLIAGYSNNDLHVNSWIYEEGGRLHGTRFRVVGINPAWPPLPPMLILGGSDGCFPPAARHAAQIIDYLRG